MSQRLTLLSARQPLPLQAGPARPVTPVSDAVLKALEPQDDDGSRPPPALASRNWVHGHTLFENTNLVTIIVTYLGNPGYRIDSVLNYDPKIVLEALLPRGRNDDAACEQFLAEAEMFDPEHTSKISTREVFLNRMMSDAPLINSLKDLKKIFSKIQCIYFGSDYNEVTNQGLVALSEAYPDLQALVLEYQGQQDGITDIGLKSCASLLHSLTKFKLTHQSEVSDEGIQSVIIANPKLTQILFHQIPLLTNASLAAIAENCPGLKEIQLTWLSRITAEGIEALLKGCPKLFSVTLSGSQILTEEQILDLVHKYPQTNFVLDGEVYNPDTNCFEDPDDD